MKKINTVFFVLTALLLTNCASNVSNQTSQQKASFNETATIYYVNGKVTTKAEYDSFVENLNSEKIDFSHEVTRNGESTFYRLKDARGHLYQVSLIVENQRRTMSVNVLSK